MPGSSRSLFLHLLSLFSLLPAYADLAADRTALLRLSSSVLGRTLVWNQSQSDPCAWEGILCSNNSTRRVVELRLPGDGLSGQIPSGTIGNLTQLRVLSLRQNSLSGQIPPDIGLCTQLREINLRGNQLSGEIPGTLFSLTNLINLDFSGNNILGEIPSSFNNLIQLQTMYLENNRLNGVIPDLSNLAQLGNFNVSNNRLNGTIPSSLAGFPSDSFVGNSLCGSPLEACTDGDDGGSSSEEKKLSAEAIAGIAIGSVCGVIIVLSLLFIVWTRKLSIDQDPEPRSSALPVKQLGSTDLVRVQSWIEEGKGNEGGAAGSESSDDDGLVFFKDGVKSFKLQQLLMAAAEVMGKGRFATTYRAYVDVIGDDDDDDCDERKEKKKKKKKMKKKSVIVKRLKDVCVNIGEREFRKRVEATGRLKHENLIPLLAYFYGKDERLLVYDDLGSRATSLASVLHGGGGGGLTLTWEIRRKVSLEIAKAIEYLHYHDSDPYFSHGNINSSNVLLLLPAVQNTNNNKFITSSAGVSATAYLSELGISPLISSSSNNGYWAPEIVDSQRMTQKADVYSFGVLILELLTGKDPSGGVDLARWVHESVVVKDKYWSIHRLLDQELVLQQQQPCHGHALNRNDRRNQPKQNQHQQQQMVELLHLGISCTSTHPDKRPSIFQVRKRIHQIIISST